MKTLSRATRSQLAKADVWITQTGEHIAITDMKTSHLYYTLTMLWNNTMPVKTRTNYKQYNLVSPRFQNSTWLKKIIRNLFAEISRRDDVLMHWHDELMTMYSYYDGLQDVKDLEPPVIKQLTGQNLSS